jgi:hypothetical protein
MARGSSGLIGKLQEAVEQRTGKTVVDQDRLQLLEASDVERRAMQKELDMLGYYVLDQIGGQPQEVKAIERRKMAAQARMVWIQDPVAGANVDISCQFIFGRGVPKPKCVDEKVQEVVDEAWSDPDNMAALTTFPAQVALCTDLVLQSNLFILFFENGDDGKVKLGMLNHDLVEDAVRDSQNRLRVLYYVARRREYQWDYTMDRVSLKSAASLQQGGQPVVQYYQSLAATDSETGLLLTEDPPCPPEKLGEGLVYHIAINRGTEQVFGIPAMRRMVKWMAALNDFMAARVDMTQAAAAFIMRRTVKGSPQQVAAIAAQALSRTSTLAATSIDSPDAGVITPGPRPASMLNESAGVTTEPFSVSTQAAQASQDAQMIRSQISAGTWPQHYLGDQSNANLATAASLELPVMKKVEAFQELFEGLFRTFTDRVIQKAVDAGTLPTQLTPEERAKLKSKQPGEQVPGGEGATPPSPAQTEPPSSMTEPMDTAVYGAQGLTEAYHGQTEDEEDTERNLSYEFSMPSPLKRQMSDLITSIANLARTFDPNNTNLELSRTLLAVALGQGLELADPAAAVERILPEGYVDPLMAQQMAGPPPTDAQPGGGGGPAPPLIPSGPNPFAPQAMVPGQGPDGEMNPYGAQGFSSQYQGNQGQGQQMQQAAADEGLSPERVEEIMRFWDEEIGEVVDQMLAEAAANGNGKH